MMSPLLIASPIAKRMAGCWLSVLWVTSWSIQSRISLRWSLCWFSMYIQNSLALLVIWGRRWDGVLFLQDTSFALSGKCITAMQANNTHSCTVPAIWFWQRILWRGFDWRTFLDFAGSMGGRSVRWHHLQWATELQLCNASCRSRIEGSRTTGSCGLGGGPQIVCGVMQRWRTSTAVSDICFVACLFNILTEKQTSIYTYRIENESSFWCI